MSSLPARASENCSEAALPRAATEVLKTKYPSWRPKSVSDLDTEDQQLWLKAHNKQCPGIAVGHFEHADTSAYAILLVPKAKPLSGYKLIVLTAPRNGEGYTSRVLDHSEEQSYSGMAISALPPGKYSDVEDTKPMRVKLDSIQLEWIEKAAVLFYWAEGGYRKLQTSD